MSPNQVLFSLARRHPELILLNIGLGFSSALFNGISTALIIPVLLGFLDQPIAMKGLPPIIQSVLSPFSGLGIDYNLLLTGTILVMLVLKNLASYCNALAAGKLKRATANDLRERGLQLLLEVDVDYFVKTGIGDISNRLNNELSRAASAVSMLTRMTTLAITLLVFVGLLLSLSWQLTLVSTLLLAVVALANQGSIIHSKTFGRAFSKASRAYSASILDLLSGMRLVRSSATEQREYHRIQQQILAREEAEFRLQVISSLIDPISEITGILALFCIVVIGRTFLSSQLEAFSAILLTYLFVLFRTLPLIAQLNNVRSQLASVGLSLELSRDFLSRANKTFMPNGTVAFKAIERGIQFNQIYFAYPGQQQQILRGVDLYLPRNTTLALVGASGAGKSTLADLLPRFYDPSSGSILVDGHDLRDLDFRTFRRAMGIVSQDTFLFNNSVRENIAYGCPNATDDQIIEAAKQANAYEFIIQLPQGFETEIGDRGVMLSGGQRQRIAIARALLQNPEILILDEATSALDTVSERLVQEAIERLSHNRTTLVIAHRLSTVQKADQIAVMDQGRVVELGTHEQLLARKGYYARLCQMQSSEETLLATQTQQYVAKTSFQMRSLLNSMIGSLGLVVDGLAETPEEQSEYMQEALTSALSLIKSLEQLEHQRQYSTAHSQPAADAEALPRLGPSSAVDCLN